MKRGREYHSCWEEYTVGKGKEYLPYNIKVVGKNYKWAKGEGDGKLGGENQDLEKMAMGKNINLFGTLHVPVFYFFYLQLKGTVYQFFKTPQ